ncbi:G-type lectin S-receptor-like serine/threonine-protein kinase At4g27290 isoform X1 [Cajanus cajan]|uniref:G-type lectin S-receptor-like serine/threonine-protein kinase At4g27290 isoform X1 n=1 Tax=Cajanus cajan TaxID=3821 RepID=UPI00098DC87B|nr:G-type lectin S-receptor-like serine/threonine-protein kinase At4g27290 isoform X1 [Cajanus cajan]
MFQNINKRKMTIHPLPSMLVIANLLFFSHQISSETDTLTQFQSLPDGTRTTLVSKDGTFELGFFSPGSSTNRYLGIWFKNIPLKTVVWVANRDNPINNNSTKLTIAKEGNLALLTENDTVHWSTNATAKAININVVAQLLDSGNLVLRDEKDNYSQNLLWQSFDHPSDTLLPGMKLGWEVTKDVNLNRYLTAWNNWEDPSSGHFTYGFSRSTIPEKQMWNGSSLVFRNGPWNGIRFSGTPSLKHRALFGLTYMYDGDECYFQFYPKDKSLISRIVLNQTLYVLQRFIWVEGSQKWELYMTVPGGYCDGYNHCGSFGYCAMVGKSPLCECLHGFEPKSPRNWVARNWSEGCVRSSKTWRCREKNNDGFVLFSNMKVPDTNTSWINRSMTIEECKAKCWENCSCTAYANSDIIGKGSGCILWFGDLLDMRQLPNAGQDLYVRVYISQMENQDAKGGSTSRKVVVVVTTVVSSVIIAMVAIFMLVYCNSKTKFRGKDNIKTKVKIDEDKEDLELPLFDFDTIACATNDFSSDNKLGQGGFGPVYKGTLPDGQDIAVKRLSHTSTQGLTEFKNEVIFCSKLQHRNLVKVLGCCIEEQEKLLIYEYMPNKSLDFFLFDYSQSKLLDWSKRYNIINGIVRGLLYLHQDSRLRIIHRDLKTSNILLDNDMNPKISDFGLARMCRGDQVEGNTSRVVGTYGYMAPEYAIDGVFSIKSDVYSFGILLLEVLSGKKNKGISCSNDNNNLVGHAWRLWKECTPKEFIDTCMGDSYILSQVLRCIHIGLLCVQHQPNDRPNMTSVVVMLTSENALPQPKEPIFLTEMVSTEEDSGQKVYYSTNEVTISKLEPR